MRAARWRLYVVLWFGFGCHESDRLVSLNEPVLEDPAATDSGAEPEPPVPSLAEADHTPTQGVDGVPAPLPGVYTTLGVAPRGAGIRGLISFPIRNRAELEETIRQLYDPASERFRQYMTPRAWIDKHAPWQGDVNLIAEWLRSRGMNVPRVATNRLFLQFTGTVGQFNDTFGTEVIILERKSPQMGNDPHAVYGFTGRITVPTFVRERIHAVATLDLEVDTRTPPPESSRAPTTPPPNVADHLTPEQIAHAYGFDDLYQQGFTGAGIRLGVTVGAALHVRDMRAFWKAFGIERADPIVVQTMEPPATRYREAALDVQWSGAMAPGAELVVYMGPDARNTSMVFTFNEAIARGEVSVITDSFAHREDAEPRAVHEAYGNASMMAAALGITVVSASGDSAGVDVPSSSPYVTAVGGTALRMQENRVVAEFAWPYSGSGKSRTFPTPPWQSGLAGLDGMRAVADVALNADKHYWYMWLNEFRPNTGTSFGSPIFAAMMAVVNQARAAGGKPRAGWLNQHLYTSPAVQATFRDIVTGETPSYRAGPGWDFPTGWGAPQAPGLLQTLP